ncbi:MAG: hypothetical protein NT069_33205, partial [Planctomycetota bacterium]|nr:hypothetical protein [Planctomycetota bacterium]
MWFDTSSLPLRLVAVGSLVTSIHLTLALVSRVRPLDSEEFRVGIFLLYLYAIRTYIITAQHVVYVTWKDRLIERTETWPGRIVYLRIRSLPS